MTPGDETPKDETQRAGEPGASSGVTGVATAALGRLTNEFLIVVVVGVVVVAPVLAYGAVNDSPVALGVGAVLLLTMIVLAAVMYSRSTQPTPATLPGPTSPDEGGADHAVADHAEAVAILGRMHSFADWCASEAVPYPHAEDKRNQDARWFYGEKSQVLSTDVGTMLATSRPSVRSLVERVATGFRRLDPRLEEVGRRDREATLESLRSDLNALRSEVADLPGTGPR